MVRGLGSRLITDRILAVEFQGVHRVRIGYGLLANKNPLTWASRPRPSTLEPHPWAEGHNLHESSSQTGTTINYGPFGFDP